MRLSSAASRAQCRRGCPDASSASSQCPPTGGWYCHSVARDVFVELLSLTDGWMRGRPCNGSDNAHVRRVPRSGLGESSRRPGAAQRTRRGMRYTRKPPEESLPEARAANIDVASVSISTVEDPALPGTPVFLYGSASTDVPACGRTRRTG